MPTAQKTYEAINEHIECNQESSFRKHLGASIIGRECGRQLWYTFRWAKKERFDGRRLRLFERGQLEEIRFVGYLEGIGCTVWEVDENGKQFKISDHLGHFGGSLDGVAKGVPDIPAGVPCLCEFKTHNAKSFALFAAKTVFEAKFEHYVQMQIYMHKAQLPYALYMAVNKDDDELYLEIIQHDPVFAQQYIARAGAIIFADEAPPRISKTPGFFKCTWCGFKDICHNSAIAEINCRTCCFSTPIEKKKWRCSRFTEPRIFRDNNTILWSGCEHHIFLPDMIGKAKLVALDPNKEWIKLRINDAHITHGPKHVSSTDLKDGWEDIPF